MKFIDVEPVSNRNIYSLHLSDFSLQKETIIKGNYIVFLAEQSHNLDKVKVSNFIKSLIDSGMIYLCTWGNNCELIHDITDEIISNPSSDEKYLKYSINESDLLMTTWQKNESLPDALWFSLYNAWPADIYFNNANILFIIIDNDDLFLEINKYLSNLNLLNNEVL